MHAHGGVDMLRAGVHGLEDGARNAGLETARVARRDRSHQRRRCAPEHIMPKRVMLAAEAGCTGIVCAAGDLEEAHHYAPRLKRVTAGIRLPGDKVDDQARAASAEMALSSGADLVVVGRAVTHADDRVAAARRIHESAAEAV